MSTGDFDVNALGATNTGGDSSGEGGGDDLVAHLVGEGKKFKTVQDLAKGKVEADTFIARLQQENKALRQMALGDDDEGGRKVEELSGGNKQATSTTGNQSNGQSLTKDDVLALLNADKQQTAAESNAKAFNAEVTKLFGDKAKQVVETRLAELDIDPALFKQLVTRSPKAALETLGAKPAQQAATTGGVKDGSVNTEAFLGNRQSGEKNWAYYQDLRKKLGMDYYSPEVQRELVEQRKKLGSDFWK